MLICTLLVLFSRPVIHSGTTFEIVADWIGYFLTIIACLGRVFSSLFIVGTKNAKISTDGPFSLVRNPLYVFSFFGIVGAGLLLGHVIIFLMLLVIFFTYYPGVVKSEENYLLGKFGADYEAYCQKVPRWFPSHWKIVIPETITIYPWLVLITIRDSSLFFLVFPLVETIEILHKNNVLPTLFPLY